MQCASYLAYLPPQKPFPAPGRPQHPNQFQPVSASQHHRSFRSSPPGPRTGPAALRVTSWRDCEPVIRSTRQGTQGPDLRPRSVDLPDVRRLLIRCREPRGGTNGVLGAEFLLTARASLASAGRCPGSCHLSVITSEVWRTPGAISEDLCWLGISGLVST